LKIESGTNNKLRAGPYAIASRFRIQYGAGAHQHLITETFAKLSNDLYSAWHSQSDFENRNPALTNCFSHRDSLVR
jgi:hypothetical protein